MALPPLSMQNVETNYILLAVGLLSFADAHLLLASTSDGRWLAEPSRVM